MSDRQWFVYNIGLFNWFTFCHFNVSRKALHAFETHYCFLYQCSPSSPKPSVYLETVYWINVLLIRTCFWCYFIQRGKAALLWKLQLPLCDVPWGDEPSGLVKNEIPSNSKGALLYLTPGGLSPPLILWGEAELWGKDRYMTKSCLGCIFFCS